MNKILIVDDAFLVRRSTQRALSDAGFDVIEAEDGEAALLLSRAHSDLAAIVCDLNMPNLSGLGFVKALRAERIHDDTPIFFLTADITVSSMAEGRRLNAAAWLSKTKPTAVLVHVVIEHLKLRNAG